MDIKVLNTHVRGANLLKKEERIYGVRKADMDEVKKLSNWIPVESLIENYLTSLSNSDIMPYVRNELCNYDCKADFSIIRTNLTGKINAASPYETLFNAFKNVAQQDTSHIFCLAQAYEPNNSMIKMIREMKAKYEKCFIELNDRYPLLQHLNMYREEARNNASDSIAEYINLIDNKRGI